MPPRSSRARQYLRIRGEIIIPACDAMRPPPKLTRGRRAWLNVIEPQRAHLFDRPVVREPGLPIGVGQAVAPHHPSGRADHVPSRSRNQRIDRAYRRKSGPDHELLRRETEFAECYLRRAQLTKTLRQPD